MIKNRQERLLVKIRGIFISSDMSVPGRHGPLGPHHSSSLLRVGSGVRWSCRGPPKGAKSSGTRVAVSLSSPLCSSAWHSPRHSGGSSRRPHQDSGVLWLPRPPGPSLRGCFYLAASASPPQGCRLVEGQLIFHRPQNPPP